MGIVLTETSSGTNFDPAPAGPHQGVCVDIVDLGMVETEYQGQKRIKPMLRVVWEIDAEMADGRRFLVSRRFTASLHEKSGLRAFLEAWRGRPFTTEELAGFDLDRLLKANCILNVVHRTNGDKTFANVASVTPLLPKMARLEPAGTYVRKQDRPGYVPPAGGRDPGEDDDLPPVTAYSADEAPTIDDDGIPF